MVWSCSARWHWASSWLDDGEALACRREDSDEREMGREGRGMDMGELMRSRLGGDDEGLMLSEEPRRERQLLLLFLSSTFSLGTLIQEIFCGILRCRRRGADCRGAKRGGGGRGGGDRDTLSAALGRSSLPPSFSSALLSMLCSLLWLLGSELQTRGTSPLEHSPSLLVSRLWSMASSLRPRFSAGGVSALSCW